MTRTDHQYIYTALLRGINIGGHHKVPMAELRKIMEDMGFSNVVTLLNSGNVVFSSASGHATALEEQLETRLEEAFSFPVPVMIRTQKEISDIISLDPFSDITVTRDIRLYVSFLKNPPENAPSVPWSTDDGAFTITGIRNKDVYSVLDLSVTNTIKGVESLGMFFGKDITTRNWNTVMRIAGKM